MIRFLLLLLALHGTAGAVGTVVEDPERELRYYKAWHALEVEGRPAEAIAAFRALLADDGTSAGLQAKTRLGLARGLRLVGDEAAATDVLREVLQRHAYLPDVVRQANDLLGAGEKSPTRFANGIVVLERGQSFDLDSGATFAEPYGIAAYRCELRERDGRLELLSKARAPRRAIGDAVCDLGGGAWRELVTDQGRTAWVQVLAEEDAVVLRWVTRVSGRDILLPAVSGLFGVGHDTRIDLRFGGDERFERYRVERRDGPSSPFHEIGVVENPPYRDRRVGPEHRYGYRVTGVTPDGDEGIPSTMQATVRSRGVRRGVVTLDERGDAVDLERGELVDEGEDADLRLRGTYGGHDSVAFYDHRDAAVVHDVPPARDAFRQLGITRDRPQSGGAFGWQIPPETPFLVPLRGGGVARCWWSPREERDWSIDLHFGTTLDDGAFPAPPVLGAQVAGPVVVVDVEAPPGWEVDEVEAVSLSAPDEPRMLAVRGGRAQDRSSSAGTIVEYRARAHDEFGRRGSLGRVRLNRMPEGAFEGEFSFHYEQGYSLERRALVPREEADVVFSSCAGGISSVELTAPEGIVQVHDLLRRDGERERSPGQDEPGACERIFDSVASINPAAVRWGNEARGDDRVPASDVFVLRTRSGGFAKLVILERGDVGGSTEQPVRVRFALNHHAPTFHPAQTEGVSVGGVALDLLPLSSDHVRLELGADVGLERRSGEHDLTLVEHSTDGTRLSLRAPHGIVRVIDAVGGASTPEDAASLFARVVDFDPGAVDWLEVATGDAAVPASDVFLLRTEDGGYAKLLLEREEDGRVGIRYAKNPSAPAFLLTSEQTSDRGGIRLRPAD